MLMQYVKLQPTCVSIINMENLKINKKRRRLRKIDNHDLHDKFVSHTYLQIYYIILNGQNIYLSVFVDIERNFPKRNL